VLSVRHLESIGISGRFQYALSKTYFYGPITGGFAGDEPLVAGERIIPAFDQTHTGTAQIFYHNRWRGFWTGTALPLWQRNNRRIRRPIAATFHVRFSFRSKSMERRAAAARSGIWRDQCLQQHLQDRQRAARRARPIYQPVANSLRAPRNPHFWYLS
jgi:hypothetical protein